MQLGGRTGRRALRPPLALALAWIAAGVAPACRSAGDAALEEAARQSPGLELELEGLEQSKRSDLLDAIAPDLEELSADGLDLPDVDDLAYALEVQLRRRGFPDAYVSYALEEREGRAVARFVVEEGRRAQVSALELLGNEEQGEEVFADESLSRFFRPSGGLFGDEPWWFVVSRLEAGAEAVQDFYLRSGFLDAVVAPPEVRWEDETETRARVVVRIEPGVRWRLAGTELVTPEWLETERVESLRGLLDRARRDVEGASLPYTLRLAYAIRARLLERLAQWGHPDASCELQELPDGAGDMRVRFTLEPGPRVRIGAVRLAGDGKTRASFLDQRLTLGPGDVVDSRELRRSSSRLFETGLFRTVELRLEGDEEPPDAREVERDLVVELLELPTVELTAEPGYGSYEGPRLRLGIEDKNLFGSGRSAEAQATLGALARKLSLGVGDRALFGSDYAGSSAIYFDEREEPSFTLRERGLALAVSRAWSDGALEASLGYRFRRSDVFDVEVVDDLVEEAQADIDISSIALTLARDTRDRFFAPRSGSFARAQLEWAARALGSEVDFLMGRLEGATFRELPWPGAVLGIGLETGLIAPIGETDVIPIQVRMFNGGENTVRSFREDELGNLDSSGEPVGGEAYSVASIELRQALVGPLSGALFYDAGNLEPDHEQYLDFDDVRQAYGFGLRYALPIGPIRVDVGWNPDARDGEDDWVVHLSVGMSF